LPSLHVKLISGRSLGQARGKVSGKFSEDYFRNAAVCELDPEDLKVLGISPNENVKITTDTGSVVVRAATASQRVQRGVAFMPYGPWANAVLSSETYGTGMPSFKGVEAEITPAHTEKILNLRSLIEQITKSQR